MGLDDKVADTANLGKLRIEWLLRCPPRPSCFPFCQRESLRFFTPVFTTILQIQILRSKLPRTVPLSDLEGVR